ncbi:NAD(P)/FAD-dependent oxidoreductase [Sphingobacterium mizutaii]|uniref:NAD(P)/FAD-dependent oxidoreductase n=1 Tax=Sphingobacterium mizutaii TaxID=1010 RepID=UPI001626EB1F|nr:NAD(P)/FAD-dependent oxidoreductase [Sphingobacterium mizutaii]
MKGNTHFDVIIIGGSYAGLSAAMSLGRSLRRVLIIDSGLPCNRFTPNSHNFITNDGAVPSKIAEKAKIEVLAYPTVQFCEGRAVSASSQADRFSILLEGGILYTARKLVLATGMRDIFPDIQGFAECWGKTLIHCPYCHGYESRGKKTAIIGSGERGVHIASLVNNLTGDLTVLTNGNKDFSEEQITWLQEHNICIEEGKVASIIQQNGEVRGVVLGDASFRPFEVLYATAALEQHSVIYRDLGCELTETGHIKVDQFQQTTMGGVFACGDCSGMLRSVANAVATGNIAGAMVNQQLVHDEF